MKLDQYLHTLRTTYGYQTQTGSGLLYKYLPGSRSVLYYIRLFYTFLHSTFPARRGTLDRPMWAMYSHRCLRVVESVGGNINISGLEGVANQAGPMVFIGNHMSLVETFILPGVVLAFRSDVNFVIKEELRHYPLLGSIFKALNLIAVSRKNPREDFKVVLREGHRVLSEGGSIIIFPQATRSADFDVQAFNTLGVKLASRAGVPVIPVAIKTDFHSNGKWIKDVGPIHHRKPLFFKFGNPIPASGKSKEVHQQVVEFITQNLIAWGGKIKVKAESGIRNVERK